MCDFKGILILHQLSLELQLYYQNFHLLCSFYTLENLSKIN